MQSKPTAKIDKYSSSRNGKSALVFAVAGTNSGCGKTTVTLGLMAALKNKGLAIQAYKAGPDFIDAGIHSLVTGRQSRNLDVWMCGEDFVSNTFITNSLEADVSIVEGVMGMFDGDNNTAKLAKLIGAPVILVVDAYGAAESVGAVVRGFIDTGSMDYGVNFAGVILNRIASESHFMRVKKSITQVPVLGYLPRETEFTIPERYLGLVTAGEKPFSDDSLDRLAGAITKYVDLDLLLQEVSNSGKELNGQTAGIGTTKAEFSASGDSHGDHQGNSQAVMLEEGLPDNRICRSVRPSKRSSSIKLAVALDKAFCFYYEDNLDLLREYGAEIIPFSPLVDEGIPSGADGVYIGGGYPELYASKLSKNKKMLRSVRDWSRSGKSLYAECGGLMYLSNSVKDLSGNRFEMTGVLPFNASMRKKPVLGYREIKLLEGTILGEKDMHCRGHEFHYSEIDLSGADHNGAQCRDVYSVTDNRGSIKKESCGFKIDNTLASYVHIHFGSDRRIAKNIVESIAGISTSCG